MELEINLYKDYENIILVEISVLKKNGFVKYISPLFFKGEEDRSHQQKKTDCVVPPHGFPKEHQGKQ